MRSCASALLVCAHPDSEEACPSHAPFPALPFFWGLRALPISGSVDSHRPIPSACRATRDPVCTPPLSPRLRSASQGAHAARSPGLPRHRVAEENGIPRPPPEAPREPPQRSRRGCYGNAPSAHARARVPRTRLPGAVPTLPKTHRGACVVTSRRAWPRAVSNSFTLKKRTLAEGDFVPRRGGGEAEVDTKVTAISVAVLLPGQTVTHAPRVFLFFCFLKTLSPSFF